MKEINEDIKFASYAVLYELSNRDFKRKLNLFSEDQRYYVILASGIIGAENAKRMKEVPSRIAQDGEEFVSKLAGISDAEKDERFRSVLMTCLIESMKDELRFCCPNCLHFNECIDLDNLYGLGALFRRRAKGEETETLKKQTAAEIDTVLLKAPYWNSEDADKLCSRFMHQCPSSKVGELFGRYADIAMGLTDSFGLDYREFQREMISLNMIIAEKSTEMKRPA